MKRDEPDIAPARADRIVDFRRVPAAELRPSPANWRLHPPAQRSALETMLSRIGIVAAVIARQTDDGGLELVDGHLRADLLEAETVPVLVVDLDAEEAREVLFSLDPLGAMAEIDTAALQKLKDSLADDFPLSTELPKWQPSPNAQRAGTAYLSDHVETFELYTPPEIVDAARAALGGQIDLDPASCAEANDTIQAARYFTVDDDALSEPWNGTVWCNPPFGDGGLRLFARKLLSELEAQNTTAACFLGMWAGGSTWPDDMSAAADVLITLRQALPWWGPGKKRSATAISMAIWGFGIAPPDDWPFASGIFTAARSG